MFLNDCPSTVEPMRGVDIEPGRTQELLAALKTRGSDGTLNRSPPLLVALPRQEVQEPDRQDDSDEGQDPLAITELVAPIEAGSSDGAGTQSPPGNGGGGGQQEEDPLDQGNCPPPPPPSPASPAKRDFEEFFQIRPSRLGGLGAFAARELRRGQTILVELPLLRTTHFSLMPDYDKLSEAAKKAYLSLHGSDGDPYSRIQRIQRLNS